MEDKKLRWVYLLLLALIWGSSFILMKKALISLTPIQVGAFRILIAGIFLVFIGYKKLLKIQRRHWIYLILIGFVGNFIPVFMFAYGVQFIDSSIVSILNSLTPLNTLIIGALFFGFAFRKIQIVGILIGLLGTVLLVVKGAELHPAQNYGYAGLILIACVCYAFNVNILKKYLSELDALSIAVGNFLFLIIPAFLILYFTDIFSTFEITKTSMASMGYITILAVLGTGLATIIYNKLVQVTNPIFSSSVTYIIPIVAIVWGVLDGETVTFTQLVSGFLIILGVYLVNITKR